MTKLLSPFLFLLLLNQIVIAQEQPKTYLDYLSRARTYNTNGEYDKSIQDFTEALRLQPNSQSALEGRANSYNGKGEYNKAIQDCNEVIKSGSRDAYAYLYRALAYEATENYDLAIQDFNKVIEIDPKNQYGYYWRGVTFSFKNKYDEAIIDYNKAIQLSPQFGDCWNALGIAYLDKDENSYDKALDAFNKAIEIKPQNTDYINNRASVFKVKKEFKKALADNNEAIRLEPNNSDCYNFRGVTYDYMGDHEKSMIDYNTAVKLNPRNITALNNIGRSNKWVGRYQTAVLNFKEAMKIDPKSVDSYYGIIGALVRMHQFADAKLYYDQLESLKLNSDPNKNFYKFYIIAATENIPSASYSKALQNLTIALDNYNKIPNKETYKGWYSNIIALKGYVQEQMNNLNDAKDNYNKALIINNNQPDVIEALKRITVNQTKISLADLDPPIIELLSPQTTKILMITSNNDEIGIVGRVKDASGIASLKVNNKIIKTEDDGLFVSTILVKEGINEIVINAIDVQGNPTVKKFKIITDLVEKKYAPTPVTIIPAGSNIPRFHAILIAEQNYTDPNIKKLQNPIKDAKELKSILIDYYAFNPKNIDLLIDKNREDIVQEIIDKCSVLNENDNLIIFFAGHGTAEKDKFGNEDGFWIPSDAKKGHKAMYISSNDIFGALKNSGSKHILVIADACFSGALTRDIGNDVPLGIQKQFETQSRKIMTSGNLEPVPDNSVFLTFLIKRLRENKEKYLSSKKLFDDINAGILNNTSTNPQYAAIRNVGDEGGEFIFIKK